MVMVPAIAVGALVVFGVGYILTRAILGIIERWKYGSAPLLYRDPKEEKSIDDISKLGGGIAVVLLIILMVMVPGEWTTLIWYGLTATGILIGLLTFALSGSRSSSNTATTDNRTSTRTSWRSDREILKHQANSQDKIYNGQKIQEEAEKESEKTLAEYRAQLLEIQERQAEINAIKDDFYSLFGILDDQSKNRGILLAGILNRFYEAYGITIREAFELVQQGDKVNTEQIEGVIEIDGYLYLVEIKWQKEPIDTQDISQHLVRLFNSGHLGSIFMSNSKFTLLAVLECKEALLQKRVVLCELDEIVSLLEKNSDLKDFLRAKISSAVAYKKPLFKPLN